MGLEKEVICLFVILSPLFVLLFFLKSRRHPVLTLFVYFLPWLLMLIPKEERGLCGSNHLRHWSICLLECSPLLRQLQWLGLVSLLNTSNFLNFSPYKPCKEKNFSMLLPSLDNRLLHYLVLCKYVTAFIQDWRTQQPIFHALASWVPLHTARHTPHAPEGEEAASEVAQKHVNEC